MSAKKLSITRQLSDKLGGTWRAVRDGFGWMYRRDSDGLEVRRYAESILTYDGYSDTEFVTIFIDSNGREVGRAGVVGVL